MALSPTGDTHDPGVKPPDYQLTPERIQTIIKRGPLERARGNVEAIRLVKTLQAEKRYATPDEQDVLARYVGWGASDLAEYVDPRTTTPDHGWSANQTAVWQDLRSLLSEDERDAAFHSTRNAHFTYDLYRPIWDVLPARWSTS